MKEGKQYTEKQKLFLEYLATEECKGNVRLAMTKAGYGPGTATKDVLNPLHEEILDIAQKQLAGETVSAVHHLVSLIHSPDQLGGKIKLGAIKELMDRAGLVKKEQIQISTEEAGLFIMPLKQPQSDE